MVKINYIKLIISILLCQFAGIIGSVFTASSITQWYSTLLKPSFSPPNWLFGPVWITLYFLMGISLYLVWNKSDKSKKVKKDEKRTIALWAFAVQLILNALWSIIFFGLKSPLYGFVEISFLWFSIIVTIFLFYKVSKASSYLLIPYLLWVTFASILNASIYYLN